ncbi:MAG: hypothetical protein H0X62_10415 [Bacteroidetes bacterium]|nr:hypothetical protein [Bacteroidota bacterium]
MTKTDFFRILIKVFGLYSLIVAVFTIFPAQLSFVLMDIGILAIILILGILAFIVFIFLFLIRKPDLIIKWLKLDKGFDNDEIDFKYLETSSIIKISALIIGGILLLDNIPIFLSNSYFAFKTDIARQGLSDQQYITWGTSFINIIIGYLLLANFEKINRWFKRKEEKNEG